MTFPTAGSNEDLKEAATQAQIDRRRLEGDRLLASARALMSKNPARQGRRQAEAAARKALACYASALNWAEDTPVFDEAHTRLEEAGLWIRQTFGCQLSVQGVTYTQKCPVALAHKRFGLSIGGVGRRTCSLCGDDLSECDHMRDVAYSVPGGLSELGWCRVCASATGCDHRPDTLYRVSVIAVLQQIELEEVSFVRKPASPDARLTSLSIDTADLHGALGDHFVPGEPVSCDRCLDRCPGFDYLPEDVRGPSSADTGASPSNR